MVRELDRIHLFMLGLPPYAYAILALASVGAFVIGGFMVLSPPWPAVRPLMLVDLSILSLFWLWHLAFRWSHRGEPKPAPTSVRLSAWIAGSAVLLMLLGLWGVSLLMRQR
jgi:hypothetical protein